MFEKQLHSVQKKLMRLSLGKVAKAGPRRGWGLALVFTALLLSGLVVADARLFVEINDSSRASLGGQDAVLTINRGLLNEVLEYYREKERNFEMLKERGTTIVDPLL